MEGPDHLYSNSLLLTLALAEALKLEQDISGYTYLNQEVSKVDGMDDASNFKSMQVHQLAHELEPPGQPLLPLPFILTWNEEGLNWLHSSESNFCSLLRMQ